MWNLFKEVFRSLTKNKATLGGLTILVFLSSGIFTLFHDMSKSMKVQYQKYKNLSNGHDLTVDLNIPSSGSFYNNGYYINGLTQSNGGIYYDKPINYISGQYSLQRNIISIENIQDNFINLSTFVGSNDEFSNKYIKRNDFIKLYNALSDKNFSEQGIILNYKNPTKSFVVNQNYSLDTFTKNGNNYEEFKTKLFANKNNSFTLDKNYKLSELLTLDKSGDQIYFSQLPTLFVNLQTNEVTFDFVKGKNWEEQEQAYKVFGKSLAKLFGLKPIANSEFVYVKDSTIEPILVDFPNEDENTLEQYYNIDLHNNYSYFDLFGNEDIQIDKNKSFSFQANKEYLVPSSWAAVENEVTFFRRKLYTTTYDDENKDKWKGSYKTFISNIFSGDDNELKKQYARFAYWDKEINRYVTYFNESGIADVTPTLINSLNLSLSIDEVNNTKLVLAPDFEQPAAVKLSDFKLEEPKTISEIEGFEKMNSQNYKITTSKFYKENIVKTIRDGALSITKKSITDDIINLTGKENVGLRQTTTVESVDENGKKSVFNFVNIGDNENTINGVELNVDKPINESQNKTAITELSLPIDKFFKTKQIDSFISKEILNQARYNISPNPEYLIPDYNYENVIFVDRNNNTSRNYSSKKVYRLSDYVEDENSPLVNNFNSYGIAFMNASDFILLKAVYDQNGAFTHWINTSLPENVNGILNLDQLYQQFLQYKWILRLNYVNPNGWGRVDPNFPNIVSLPFFYRGPKVDILQEALNKNSLSLGLEYIQKMLYESDLVQKGFLSKEEVYAIIEGANYAINENDFARIFSSGNINLIVIPKMMLDLVYSLSHNPKGDYLTKILDSILKKSIEILNEQGTLEQQKSYLKEQLNNLFTFVKGVFGTDLSKFIAPQTLIDLSKDPKVFLQSLRDIVASFDFRSFSDKVKVFFDDQYNKKTLIDGIERERKISITEVLIWLFETSNQSSLKDALFKFLDNINIKFLLDSEKGIQAIVQNYIPKFKPFLSSLLTKVNDPNNDESSKYVNLINGLKFFINSFNLEEFLNVLNKQIKLQPFDQSSVVINSITGQNETVTKYYYAGAVNNIDINLAIFKSLFSVPSSDVVFKDQIVKMFNLSNKGFSIKIDENKYLNLPAPDDQKLGFFDFIDALTTQNNIDDLESLPLYNIDKLLKKLKTQNELKFNSLSFEERKVAVDYLGLADKVDLNEEQLKEVVQKWDTLFSLLVLDDSNLKYHTNMSIGSLGYFFKNFDVSHSSELFYTLSKKLLEQLIKNPNQNQYSYPKDSWILFKEWWNLYTSLPNVNHARKIEFLNKWLEIANNESVVQSFNDFELFKPSSQNIALYENTKFGISRSLANPRKMQELFFAKNNNRYKNPLLDNLFKNYSEFYEVIAANEYGWTVVFSQIAASHMYFNVGGNSLDGQALKYSALQSVVIDNFINGFLNNQVVIDNQESISRIFANSFPPLSLLGIPDTVVYPLLISFYPQTLVWYLTNTDDVDVSISENANLAYFVKNKLVNFEEIANLPIDKFTQWIKNFASEVVYKSTIENDLTFAIAIDDDFFTWQKKQQAYLDGHYTVFGVNLFDIILGAMDSITAPVVQNNFLTFSQSSSSLVKANYAWLQKNNKKIYTGEIPQNPILMQALLEKIDKDFVVEINGSRFIIVGDEGSFDYLYPVIDEANLQVDVENQGILYVNDKGFSRIRYSYLGNALKEYLVVKKPQNVNVKLLQNKIEDIIQNTIDDPNRIKRTYLNSELDGLNPERSLRISAIEKIIKSVSTISLQLSIIMIFLVSISVIFIIKRYVSNKNKVIGILVAQGYTPMQIAMSMTIFAFFTALIGGTAGYLAGFLNQAVGIKIISAYWTIPIETLSFSLTSFASTVILPMIGMSLLIAVVTLYSLRWKAIDLMSGIADLSIGNLQQKYQGLFKKVNIKGKFSASLIFNSFWKLAAFGFSIILTSIATIFQFSTLGVFEKSINKTYENRDYSYRFDLLTPTTEGGALMPFNNQLQNNLYVPLGNISEFNQIQSDYFKVGKSSAINIDDRNGNPSEFDAHVITQFSVNLKIDSTISIDPWTLVYNNLPDSQKARINKLRDQVAIMLEKTQSHVVFDKNNVLDVKETSKSKKDFFHYVPNAENPIEGKFFYLKWNNFEEQYDHYIISTGRFRNEYRDFLVNAYAQISQGRQVNDYFVSFGGVYFNDQTDEVYTYVDSVYEDTNIRLYGYQRNSQQLKLIDAKGQDLLTYINDEFDKNNHSLNEAIPLVINNVVKDKYNLTIGSKITIPVLNTTDRYTQKINALLNNEEYKPTYKNYTFKVVGINPTFINNELIIPKKAADMITGLDSLNNNPKYGPFNGILSKDKVPQQLLNSASVYSYSGYAGALQSFDIKTAALFEKQNIFDALFASKTTAPNLPTEGLLKRWGWSDEKIAKFIDSSFDPSNTTVKEVYDKGRNLPDVPIQKFGEIYDNLVYVSVASSLDSKDIEVGFTTTIAKTVQVIVTFITLLTFIVSMVILIIVSTILINENEKNIAIWTILGYSQKEKIKMFFGIYVPFILISILLSIPITYGLISFFSGFLTTAASIAIPLSLSIFSVGITFAVIFGVFIVTSIISWRNINKIKAIDLLKGK
ncbi:ABC transporter permease [Mycoplasmopsis columboralis]|uniref:Uncharacterized ABC transporter permease MG468 homolog n=1 Tax=Mycoplasmopsis columboralis TaxID=171282 RepID=A0A449B6X2_9BACT|nr:FtsX-like permease family protein [Mycoplasmopsis columboralis]VEU76329.1 Uncharacterized ABC transporter permease MG468 homolog [Mycoplasmopsis columboralis]